MIELQLYLWYVALGMIFAVGLVLIAMKACGVSDKGLTTCAVTCTILFIVFGAICLLLKDIWLAAAMGIAGIMWGIAALWMIWRRKKMTFKEKLIKMADEYVPDISERMSYIKERLEKAYNIRHFTISLIDMLPSSHWTIGEGQYKNDLIALHIPNNVQPNDYVRAYIEEFKKLGFTDKDITHKVVNYHNCYDAYQIILTW